MPYTVMLYDPVGPSLSISHFQERFEKENFQAKGEDRDKGVE